jgi:L-lactate utilization protein LutC
VPAVQQAYAVVVAMCANGSPTNLISGGLDIADIEIALAPYVHLTATHGKALMHMKHGG